MLIWNRFDGNLGGQMSNEGMTRATAHYCFTIVNEEHDKSEFKGDRSTGDVCRLFKGCYVLFEGDFEEFFPAVCEDSLGFSICPAARVKDPSGGFLKQGFFSFRVRAEIRLKLQDNERWTVSDKRKTATCTVCLTSPSKHIEV